MGFTYVKHGFHGTPTYRSWRAMKTRCLNPNVPDYKRYGGRGITITPEWLIFENFLKDMGVRPNNKTLDRKDNSLGYNKYNCIWSTQKEQNNNTRTNNIITYQGQTKTLQEWSDISGIDRSSLRTRLKNGWSIDKLFTPTRKWRKHE